MPITSPTIVLINTPVAQDKAFFGAVLLFTKNIIMPISGRKNPKTANPVLGLSCSYIWFDGITAPGALQPHFTQITALSSISEPHWVQYFITYSL